MQTLVVSVKGDDFHHGQKIWKAGYKDVLKSVEDCLDSANCTNIERWVFNSSSSSENLAFKYLTPSFVSLSFVLYLDTLFVRNAYLKEKLPLQKHGLGTTYLRIPMIFLSSAWNAAE